MARRLRQFRKFRGELLIIAVAVALAWVSASIALSNLRQQALAADLSSSLKADYSAGQGGEETLSPINSAIVDSVAKDERERDASQISFEPIFLGDEGNQAPVRLPSGEVQPAPTPSPTPRPPTDTPEPAQPGSPTPGPQPTGPSGSTSTPNPTQPADSTPTPNPTQPADSTPTPNPTQPGQPTHTPKPTQAAQPTHTPKPTQLTQPTDTPKPTQPGKPTHTPRPGH